MLFSFPLKIHVWGGLGSQLHAWALAELIQCRSRRPVVIVLHTAGVTKRVSDIDFIDSRFLIKKVDDFSPLVRKSKMRKLSYTHKFFFISIAKWILLKLQLVIEDSKLEKSLTVKPWTLAVRGHYTRISIPSEVVQQILINARQKGLISNRPSPDNVTLFHYRLGDLLLLQDDKKPIDSKRFKKLQNISGAVRVVSDSPKEAVEQLSLILERDVKSLRHDSAWDVISSGINARVFIGTPSKISFWIIAFRSVADDSRISYITYEHLPHLSFIVPVNSLENIKTY